MNKLTAKSQIKTATMAELLAFFNANTGGAQVKKFSDRKNAETRVSKLMDEMIADGDMPAATPMVAKLLAAQPKAKADKPVKAVKEPKAKADKPVKAVKEPKAPKVKTVKTLTATALATSPEMSVRPDSFRGQILATIIANPGISKANVIAKHESYTHDVICKFKAMGLVEEGSK